MKHIFLSKIKRPIILGVLVIGSIGILGCLIMIYTGIILPYINSSGKLSSELYLSTEDNYYDDFLFDIEGKIAYDSENSVNYTIVNANIYESEFWDIESLTKEYLVLHFKNGDRIFSNHLNQMVGDCILKVDHKNHTLTQIYKTEGPIKILYACDDYIIVFDAHNNECQWIDYKNDEILQKIIMNLDLDSRENYICKYNSKKETLTFELEKSGKNIVVSVVNTKRT